MTADAIFRIGERAKADIDTAEREGRVQDLLRRVIDELAAEESSRVYLLLDTRVAQAGPDLTEEFARSIQVQAALASLHFAEAVNVHLGPFLEDHDECTPVRVFHARLTELARDVGAGGCA